MPLAPDTQPPASRTPALVVPVEDLERLVGIMSKATTGDFSERPEIPEGDDVWTRFMTGFRFLLDDLERADQLRRREVERMREIDRLKTRFINMAAHELGTPLTPITLQLALLREDHYGPLSPRQRHCVDILERNSRRMQSLVADLLDVARIESRELRFERKPADLADIAREAVDSFADTAAKRGLALTHHLVPAPVQGDPARLSQVVFNLLTNAIKCTTPPGSIAVEVRRRGDMVELEVRDTGIGLTQEQIGLLFRPFSQAHPGAVAGTGLGLYISKGIVERHGGLMAVQSRGHGKGSSFVVTLPVDQPPGAVAYGEAAAHG